MPQRPSDQNEPGTPEAGRAEQTAGAVLAPGSRFSSYVIRDLIGSGGMARVYRAEHAALGRDVALKVLRLGALPGQEAIARFLQEGRIAASLQNPNVVQVFDVGVHEQLPYLAMELLEGEDLDVRLRSEGAIVEAALVDIALPVMSALASVHAAGVVHRDLKPSNIFLARTHDDETVPKLVDFGISKLTQREFRLTSAGRERLLGTPLYMAPELLSGGEATPASDQYSLGVILYECVTGVNPFSAASSRESVRRIGSGKRRRALDQIIAPSPAFAEIIERALAVDPARRFPDVLSMGRALLQLATHRTRLSWELKFGDLRAHPAGGSAPESRARSGPARRQGMLTFVAALGWLTAAALLSWQLSHRSEGSDPLLVQGPPRELHTERHLLQPLPPSPVPLSVGRAALAEPDAGALPGVPGRVQLTPRTASTRQRELEPWPTGHAPAPAPERSSAPDEDAGERLHSVDGRAHPPPLRGTNNAPIFE